MRGMSDEPDWRRKEEAFNATLILGIGLIVLMFLVVLTDWLLPKILGTAVLILMTVAAIRLGIRMWRSRA
jgi:hypothetical protein